MMDRAHTPVSQLTPGQVDWAAIFCREGARWFHTGGIMCALAPQSPALVQEAMQAAKAAGTVVSFDCNYRPSLWKDQGGRQASIHVNRALMPFVDVLFGHEGDIAATMGESSHGPAWHDEASYRKMSERVAAEFPNIKVIATTTRRPVSANRNDWAAFAYANDDVYASKSTWIWRYSTGLVEETALLPGSSTACSKAKACNGRSSVGSPTEHSR